MNEERVRRQRRREKESGEGRWEHQHCVNIYKLEFTGKSDRSHIGNKNDLFFDIIITLSTNQARHVFVEKYRDWRQKNLVQILNCTKGSLKTVSPCFKQNGESDSQPQTAKLRNLNTI